MPNWCENDLRLKGPKNELQKLFEVMKGEETEFDFGQIVPLPLPFLDEYENEPPLHTKPVDDLPWYEDPPPNFYTLLWCTTNWGTKWNASEVSTVRHDAGPDDLSFAEVYFRTPWTPPAPVVRRLSAAFPAINFDLRYYEGGCGFQGILQCSKGDIIRDELFDYYGPRGG